MKNNLLETAQNKLISAMLQDISPIIHQACVDFVQPMVTDIDQLPIICDQVRKVKEVSNENMAYYIAVLMRLYSPGHLYLDGCRLPTGLRTKFIQHFGYNNEEIWNHYATPVRSHMKNSRFANAVNVCAIEIAGNLKTNGELLKNIGGNAPSPQPFENLTFSNPILSPIIEAKENQAKTG